MPGKTISSVSVGLFGNVGQFTKAFGQKATSAVSGFVGSVTSAAGTLAKFTGVGAAIGLGMKGIDAALGGVTGGFKTAASMEQAQVAMETMLGSADAARKVLGDLTSFAASTPFEMPELVDSTKKLVAFGIAQDKLMPTLNAIGDVASGVGVNVSELAEIYGKAKTQGTLMAEDINQLTGRGIPIIAELAKQFGVTEGEVKKLVSEGKVGFGNLEKAFASMTGPGGKFAGMMEKQSGTLAGLWSTLSDTIGMTLAKVAQQIIDTFNIKDGIKGLTAGLGNAAGVVTGFVAKVAPIIKGFALAVYNAFTAAYQYVAPIVTRIYEVVANVFGLLVPKVIGVMQAVWSGLVSVWNAIYKFVAPIATGIYQVITSTWEASLQTVTAYALGIWGVVKSVFGVVANVVSTLWSGIVAVWNWGSELIFGKTTTVGNATVTTFQKMGEWSRWMMDKLTFAFNVTEYVISHWRDVLDLAVTKAALGIVRFANQVQYFLVDVIPAVASWFADNWKEIFIDQFNFTTTIYANLARNIVRIIKNIPKLIKGDVTFGDLWTPLTDGFKATLKELPNIPERQLGDLEKALDQNVSDLEGRFSKGLGDHLTAKQKEAADAAKGIADGIKDVFKEEVKPLTPEIKPPEAPKVPPVKLDANLNNDNLKLTVTPEIKRAKAITFGSAEAQLLRLKVPELAKAAPKPGAAPAAPAPVAPAAPQPAAPTGPVSPEARQASYTESKGMEKWWAQYLAEAKKQTSTLDKIEQNTRAGTTLGVASF